MLFKVIPSVNLESEEGTVEMNEETY